MYAVIFKATTKELDSEYGCIGKSKWYEDYSVEIVEVLTMYKKGQNE